MKRATEQTTVSSAKEFQDSEIPDGRSPVSERLSEGSDSERTTVSSAKEFQDSEILDGLMLRQSRTFRQSYIGFLLEFLSRL